MDITGPNTLDGGYSPSQYVSSALNANGVSEAINAGARVLTTVCEIVAKAFAEANTMATMKKLSLDMMEVFCCEMDPENGRKRWVGEEKHQ